MLRLQFDLEPGGQVLVVERPNHAARTSRTTHRPSASSAAFGCCFADVVFRFVLVGARARSDTSITGRPAVRRPVEHRDRTAGLATVRGRGSDHGHARLLSRRAGELLDWVALLDAHAYEVAVEPRGQRFRVADGAPAVLGAVLADHDGPWLAERGVRGHDHHRTRRVGGERSRDAAVEEALEALARRRPGHEQRRVAVDRSSLDHGRRPPGQHAAHDITVRECRERRLELRPRGVLRDLLLDFGQRIAHVRIDARPVRRQRGEVVVVHDVHELERDAQRTGKPRCDVGGQERWL